MLLLVMVATLAAASCLLMLVSENFAGVVARAVEGLSSFFEYKASLRCARNAGLRHS
jgi:hypothetical protein